MMPLGRNTTMGLAACAGVSLVAGFIFATASKANTARVHHFDVPYQCDRTRDVTSSRTGEAREVTNRSVYFPDLNRRIDLIDINGDREGFGGRGIANTYERGMRYDGIFRGQGDDITSISMGTAWPQDDPGPEYSVLRSADDSISRCQILTDDQIGFYQFDDLDSLEVMGQ